MMIEEKKWYVSKTVWFNILAVVLILANANGFAGFELDANIQAAVVAILNLVLRFMTKGPIV